MEGGFTYGGVDIASLGFEYVPENQYTYVYQPAVFAPQEQAFEAHDGAYFYGATYKPKDFSLRLIYEDKHLMSGALTRLFNLFQRGKTAKLVFARRPWVWYMATVLSIDASQVKSFMNGVVTVNLRAYYPFGRSDLTYIEQDYEYKEDLLANSAMVVGNEWQLDKDFASNGAITAANSYFIYNPGTQSCPVCIEIAGDFGTGITITNANTQQLCEIKSPTGGGLTSGQSLTFDALNGKVLIHSTGSTEYGYIYHDNGFIDLASSYPIQRGVHINGTSGTSYIVTEETILDDLVGQYVALGADGAFLNFCRLNVMRLGNESGDTAMKVRINNMEQLEGGGTKLYLDSMLTTDVTAQTNILPMNMITVTPKSTMNLTKLIFHYKPTFS